MKKRYTYLFFALAILATITACNQPKPTISASENDIFNKSTNDTVTIENDSLEYEIIIIDPGYNSWLQGIARPRGYYSQTFLENRNIFYVNEWNRRASQPMQYNPNLYEMQINYQNNIDYGYEVNYQLYNYFIYFQRKYAQRLGPFVPRI
ncbi:hypothetical protein SAMN05216480_11527 [Pustulibacterium marinum]|uniref:Lipoprotein n=1 Tax=Pustulibacterium marinum TaxID=1224947 RepID=A0A1I7IDC5_9FLAO|nr:DUF6146 family protein [Pustulibacterium marinum]SFU70934.1 hypothetical protein SAMN05216480_11527 [Pustulibacterium marinum]